MFLKKLDAAATEGIRSERAIVLTSVMSQWYASFVLLRMEKEKEPTMMSSLHMGGVNGTSCQHSQVLTREFIA